MKAESLQELYRDAAFIAAVLRANLANLLGDSEAAILLEQTIEEEKEADDCWAALRESSRRSRPGHFFSRALDLADLETSAVRKGTLRHKY